MRRPIATSWLLASVLTLLATGGAPARAADFALANGLKVRLVPIADAEEVALLLAVRAGFVDEPAGLPHLAHVTEHLVVFGGPAGSDEAKAIQRWFSTGRANAETLPGFLYFDLFVTPDELPMALRVQAIRLARPAFNETLLADEVPRALGELTYLERSKSAGTDKFAWSAFVQAALHGKETANLKARTRTFRLDDVRAFHARTFRPDRASLVVVGAFDPRSAREQVEEQFGVLTNPPVPVNRPPLQGLGTDRRVTWDARTSHLMLAWPTPPASTPDHAALSLAAEGLNAQFAADRSLAGLSRTPRATNEVEGLFLIGAQAEPGADLDGLKVKLLDRVGRLVLPEEFDDAQIGRARQAIVQDFRPGFLAAFRSSISRPTLKARANDELRRLAREMAWGQPEAYLRLLDAAEGPAVRAAVSRLLTPDRLAVIRVTPPV